MKKNEIIITIIKERFRIKSINKVLRARYRQNKLFTFNLRFLLLYLPLSFHLSPRLLSIYFSLPSFSNHGHGWYTRKTAERGGGRRKGERLWEKDKVDKLRASANWSWPLGQHLAHNFIFLFFFCNEHQTCDDFFFFRIHFLQSRLRPSQLMLLLW